jgi:hypothetical protein
MPSPSGVLVVSIFRDLLMSQNIVHQSELIELVSALAGLKAPETDRSFDRFASKSSRPSIVSAFISSAAAISFRGGNGGGSSTLACRSDRAGHEHVRYLVIGHCRQMST